MWTVCRNKKLSEAKVYAEQELNKHRRDYEARYVEEEQKVFISEAFTHLF
jgi:hypothetical protein